jgi:hypothetical protein
LIFSAPTALADPADPAPAPEPAPAAPPDPVPVLPSLAPPPAAEPASAPADPAIPAPAPPLAPTPDGTVQAAAGTLPTPADGVPHLSSPDNLPPGTTNIPNPQGGGSYLRDLWHAYQTQEISGRDALLLLSQRPMNVNALPPAGTPADPTPPLAPVAALPPASEPAPPPPLPLPAPAP